MANPEKLLPPGFRFHPTDEELILHYLKNKATSMPCPVSIIAEVDIYKFDPWDLPGKALFGDREWYFFSPRDRKYPNGIRPNRAAGCGYWKATGTDKPILTTGQSGQGKSENIGVKKALVFYRGKPPKGTKTNWIMHEYRLSESAGYTNHHIHRGFAPIKHKDCSMRLDDWVLCRIYEKSNHHAAQGLEQHCGYDSNVDEAFLAGQTVAQPHSMLPRIPSLSDFLASNADLSMLTRFLNEANPLEMPEGAEQLGAYIGLCPNPSSFVLEDVVPGGAKRQRPPEVFAEEGPSAKRYHGGDVGGDHVSCTLTGFASTQLGPGQFGLTSQTPYPSHHHQQMLVMHTTHLQHH